MRSTTLFLALVLATGCLWAQENKEAASAAAAVPCDKAVPIETFLLQKKGMAPPAGAATAPVPAPAASHPAMISCEDKARKNPVEFTEVSTERGKKIYNTQCAICHGSKGDGKGDLAADLKVNMPDFTKPATLKDWSDGEIFTLIGVGADPMPPQTGRLSDTHRWNLVNYLRSVSGQVPGKATGKEPEENILLVPQTPQKK